MKKINKNITNKYIKYLLLLTLTFNSQAESYSLTKWEANIDIPDSVYRVKDIKDNKSVEYEIAAYEAAMDLIKIANANSKLGNTLKSLQFLALATHLFPYRDDIVNNFKRTLMSYIDETNDLISAKKIECHDLKNRVSFISSISPKEAYRLKNNESCLVKENNRILTLDQIDLGQWINQSKQFQNETSETTSDLATNKAANNDTGDDLFFKAQKMQKEEQQYAKESNTVYELKFPKVEILVNAMKVLGNFRFVANKPEVQTINQGDVILMANYEAITNSSFTFEGLCRTIAPYFSLPEGKLGSYYTIGKIKCGYEEADYKYNENVARFTSGDWDFRSLDLSLMPDTSNYISDDPNSNTPLYRFLPRVLDMNLIYVYSSGERRSSPFQVKISNTLDFFGWLYFPELISESHNGFQKPEIINDQAHIVFLQGNRFAIPIVDINKLKGLSRVEISFDQESTFKRMVKLLDIKLKN